MSKLTFGAGIWHFATYVDRYATDGYGPAKSLIEMIDLAGQVRDLSVVDINAPWSADVSVDEVEVALKRNNLSVIGITPEIYNREFSKGAFTNPDAGIRRRANEVCNDAANLVRRFGASYVKLWPGQDGWDYPFQVDHKQLWRHSIEGIGELASQNPDLKFVIEYKPREPRVHMSYGSMARTLLGIEAMGVPNVGVLLDFGHALFGGESPADSAQLAIDHGRLFGMDVNDNLRAWDDDMVAGTVHPIELFEFFYTLRKNNWEGVWQLDQFPFREDCVEAADMAIDFLKHIDASLDRLDWDALAAAQSRQNAMGAQKIARQALFGF
ncbi:MULTISPECIES: sugar phosphate isomerase/epimerase family protein [unclassified Novosphingobium]|uniref:sugar phosphate isomerase/epimerase family protein n=1 Tax=unclassified Novosphingobium TaxID=2644732 RepID=UPI0008690A92|nr:MULTISPECIES: TIM barrel protein [unclassified Novosphingobium]MBN9145433.1 TIM barrel protein [Novosphingobium sp.]MDR6709826.1 xylose isomerase [Novosphingobium sp. 1748]ODU83106.1 MAG: xylose isomerase [Novosphingobium sp. SCN 63-17]OJX88152.1 MAG: xylose isomerase [Novosphingobium sp. 63-713]